MNLRKAIRRELCIYNEITENNFGFRLTWAEQAALVNYLESFSRNRKKLRVMCSEGYFRFMLDYFDISMYEISKSKKTYLGPLGKIVFEEGTDLLGTPEFKEYCREIVKVWRDERELL